jgi:hypothetical protein
MLNKIVSFSETNPSPNQDLHTVRGAALSRTGQPQAHGEGGDISVVWQALCDLHRLLPQPSTASVQELVAGGSGELAVLLADLQDSSNVAVELQVALGRLVRDSRRLLPQSYRLQIAREVAAERIVEGVMRYLRGAEARILQKWEIVEREEMHLMGRRQQVEAELMRLESELEEAADLAQRDLTLEAIEETQDLFENLGGKLEALQIPVRQAAAELERLQIVKQSLQRFCHIEDVVKDLARDGSLGCKLARFIPDLPPLNWDLAGQASSIDTSQADASEYFLEHLIRGLEGSAARNAMPPTLATVFLRLAAPDQVGGPSVSHLQFQRDAASGRLRLPMQPLADQPIGSVLRRDLLAQPRREQPSSQPRSRRVRFDALA